MKEVCPQIKINNIAVSKIYVFSYLYGTNANFSLRQPCQKLCFPSEDDQLQKGKSLLSF